MKSSLLFEKEPPVKEIRKLLDFTRLIHAERDLFPLLELVSQKAKHLLEAERASVFLLDKEKCELSSLVALPNEVIKLDARLGIAGAAVMTGKIINVKDASKDSRFYKDIDKKTKFCTRSVLVVPLRKLTGELIGTLQFLNKKGGVFTEADERLGAVLADQLTLAIDTAGLWETLKQEHHHLKKENQELRSEIEERSATQRIMGMSAPIQNIIRTIGQISDCSFDVLITGENGTGKELIAKAIHAKSPRADKPFVELNCTALPENLLESELFGIEKGVATGVAARIGKFELAQGGTLFLDEIGDMPLAAQAKILRVLQERRLERIGKRESIGLDVRVIAATNKNLEDAITKGTFRQDLYYRLKVIHLVTPALREIPEDIPLLTNYFLLRYCKEVGVGPKRLAARTLRILQSYPWPGNIRQLENEMKRLAVMVRKDLIAAEDLDASIQCGKSQQTPSLEQQSQPLKPSLDPRETPVLGQQQKSLKESLDQVEKQIIEQALQAHHFHQGRTAEALGLSRQGLIKKLKRFSITVS